MENITHECLKIIGRINPSVLKKCVEKIIDWQIQKTSDNQSHRIYVSFLKRFLSELQHMEDSTKKLKIFVDLVLMYEKKIKWGCILIKLFTQHLKKIQSIMMQYYLEIQIPRLSVEDCIDIMCSTMSEPEIVQLKTITNC